MVVHVAQLFFGMVDSVHERSLLETRSGGMWLQIEGCIRFCDEHGELSYMLMQPCFRKSLLNRRIITGQYVNIYCISAMARFLMQKVYSSQLLSDFFLNFHPSCGESNMLILAKCKILSFKQTNLYSVPDKKKNLYSVFQENRVILLCFW